METVPVSAHSSVTMDPFTEYRSRLAAFRTQESLQSRREEICGQARVGTALLAVALVALAWAGYISPYWLIAPVLVFAALLWKHDRIRRAGWVARCGSVYYERGLARLEGDWAGRGQQGNQFRDEAHPYGLDLDLFGKGSLFERISTARLRHGEVTLAAWLTTPAEPAIVRARQAAVAELRPGIDLREALSQLASNVPPGVDLEGMIEWSHAPSKALPKFVRTIAWVLPALAFLALMLWLSGGSFSPLLVVVLLESGFRFWVGPRIRPLLGPVERRAHDLALFCGILDRLERQSFTGPLLRQMHQDLFSRGRPASEQIRQLRRLIDLLNSQRNQLFMPVAFLLLWDTHLATALERWRRKAGGDVARWLRVVGEFEALCALASYAFENPADPFPEILDEGAHYECEGLGHPLLPDRSCVRNDLNLGDPLRLLMVSGSNMSGKSTFLRAIGANAVLALAGAPVRARRLRLSSMSLGATLRVEDSLQAGRSRFYAELTRVQQIVELAKGSRPLLFLLDELFHGTNSHDRRAGAEGVLRGLLQHGAIGLVTTHDLSLAEVADQLAPRAANAHFADELKGDVMVFDYHLRPGVVQHSNALALMRAVGLNI